MGLKVYINGKFYPKEDAKISVFDHGLLYGDGIFEGIRCYNGHVFKLNKHIDRLFNSAKAIALKIPLSQDEIKHAVKATLDTNNLTEDSYIRLIVTRGIGKLGLDPFNCSEAQVIIITDFIELYPKDLYEKGLETIIVPTIRNHYEALNPKIKSLNYLNNILAKIECINAGAAEGIMLNKDGYVAEGTGDNIFIIKGNKIITPPTCAGILVGITRNVVIELATGEGMVVKEEQITRYDLYVADECFLTGTAAEIIPVVKIDGRPISSGQPGKNTLTLLKKYQELTKQPSD
ncbi:MAG: branched-chain-amino-acid transaminase [Planctomycetes bacterium]|nr:branched-chain-amino-acid transaminase [Planctomycetota bacterium]